MSEQTPSRESMDWADGFVKAMPAAARIKASVLLLAREAGMRQADVAEAIGMERTAFGNRMRARSRWTSEDLDGLAGAFGVDVADLFGPALIAAAGTHTRARGSAIMAISSWVDDEERAWQRRRETSAPSEGRRFANGS